MDENTQRVQHSKDTPGTWMWVPDSLAAFIELVTRYNDAHDQLAIRSDIQAFEAQLAQLPDAIVGDNPQCPLRHTFGDHVYVREILIPQGMVLTGKIHKYMHPNFLLSGQVIVVTEGAGIEVLTAPRAMMSPAGTKRAVVALTDVWWATVHVTDQTDLAAIEADVIATSYDDLVHHLAPQSQEI